MKHHLLLLNCLRNHVHRQKDLNLRHRLHNKQQTQIQSTTILHHHFLQHYLKLYFLKHLLLPHPRLTRRRFVLQPLADIRPDLVLPGNHLTIAQHLATLQSNEPAPALLQAVW